MGQSPSTGLLASEGSAAAASAVLESPCKRLHSCCSAEFAITSSSVRVLRLPLKICSRTIHAAGVLQSLTCTTHDFTSARRVATIKRTACRGSLDNSCLHVGFGAGKAVRRVLTSSASLGSKAFCHTTGSSWRSRSTRSITYR